jgi:hypothetical protein
MILGYWRNRIVTSYDSPVDISHAAWAAVVTSGGFPAVKAGIDMPAKKTDCFPGKHQFGFLSDSFIKNKLELAANQIGYLSTKIFVVRFICCICHDWTIMA